jgi:competence protein ComEC
VITHPQLDHYGGFADLLDHYDVGAFIVTGRVPESPSLVWDAIMEKIKAKKIPIILVARGDRIVNRKDKIDILSPDPIFRESGELNDTGIVERTRIGSTTILLTADIGDNVEKYLVAHDTIHSDILKVGHHGSRYSSSQAFLEAVLPKVAVIGVGENHYGHPAPGTVEHLRKYVGNNVFRTDLQGNIRMTFENGKIQIFTEKSSF